MFAPEVRSYTERTAHIATFLTIIFILGVISWGFYTIINNQKEARETLEGCTLTTLVARDEGHLREIYDCAESS